MYLWKLIVKSYLFVDKKDFSWQSFWHCILSHGSELHYMLIWLFHDVSYPMLRANIMTLKQWYTNASYLKTEHEYQSSGIQFVLVCYRTDGIKK